MAFILAIDASTKSTGIALFNDTELVMFNCLTASSSDVIKRIQKIIEQLKPLLLQYKIDTIILEEVRPITDTTRKQNRVIAQHIEDSIHFKHLSFFSIFSGFFKLR